MNIFICHAPCDSRTASKFALDLLKRGFDVWVDQPSPQGDLMDAEKRQRMIDEGITNSEIFVVVISPTALTSPELYEQVELAVEKGKPIVVALRQEAALLARIEKILKDKPTYDFSRTGYEVGLVDFLKSIGADPALIVNDIISELEVDEWMPGYWEIKFVNPDAELSGTADFEFGKDHSATGTVILPYKEIITTLKVRGNWQFINDRFTIQGYSFISMNVEEAILPEVLTYVLSLNVKDLQRGYFEAVSAVGDKVTFQKGEKPVDDDED